MDANIEKTKARRFEDGLTVREMIAKLQKLPPDLVLVTYDSYSEEHGRVGEVSVISSAAQEQDYDEKPPPGREQYDKGAPPSECGLAFPYALISDGNYLE